MNQVKLKCMVCRKDFMHEDLGQVVIQCPNCGYIHREGDGGTDQVEDPQKKGA